MEILRVWPRFIRKKQTVTVLSTQWTDIFTRYVLKVVLVKTNRKFLLG